MYYVRATGSNQLAGGTKNWLKIRGVKRTRKDVTIEVRIRDRQMFVDAGVEGEPKHLEFAKGWPGLMPVSFRHVLENYYETV